MIELYRGYDSKYPNFGIPNGSKIIWTTDDIDYASEYGNRIVKFIVDEQKMNTVDDDDIYDVLDDDYEFFEPEDFNDEMAEALIKKGFNTFIFDTVSDYTVYVLFDKSLILNSEDITDKLADSQVDEVLNTCRK